MVVAAMLPSPTGLETFVEIEDAATRREFLAILAAAGLLASCGSDGDDSPATPRTRTVASTHGPIRIPAQPRRVVAMHDQLVGYAIASLGFEHLIAIAARDERDPAEAIRQFGEVPASFEGLEGIGTYSEPDLEAITRLDPDLIIGLPYEVDKLYSKLTRIAPTVVVDLQQGNRAPFQRQRDLAAVVGIEEALDERLAEYAARLKEARSQHRGLDGVAYTYLESYGSGAEDNYVVRSRYAPGIMVLGDLGLVASSTTRSVKEEYMAVSPELFTKYDADVIFVGLPEGATLDPKIAGLLDTTHAGRNNRVFTVSRDIWSLEVAEALFASLNDVERHLGGRTITPSRAFRP
jgi:iron complex transport system substrate-binding protein